MKRQSSTTVIIINLNTNIYWTNVTNIDTITIKTSRVKSYPTRDLKTNGIKLFVDLLTVSQILNKC